MSRHRLPSDEYADHQIDKRAGSVEAARPADRQAGGGAIPTPALHELKVIPVPHKVAKQIVERHHYLHSMPGGTELCFGVAARGRLMGALTFGAGPTNAYRLIRDAKRADCLTLSRVWLNDDLPANAASRVIGIALRVIRRSTEARFVVSYADPAQGHIGGIYQAGNWIYTGVSEASPLLDLGDGVGRHSRSVSHAFGTHSVSFLKQQGIDVRPVPQQPKHRYLYFIDQTWQSRLTCPVLPYPKRVEECDEVV